MKNRLEAWLKAYERDDNAVVPTLITSAWNYAAYMTVVRIVEAAPLSAEGVKPLNFLELELLRSSYWGSAVMAVRSLVDKAPLNGPKGVCSLSSILADIKDYRELLNRRVYFEMVNLEYDYAVIEQRRSDFIQAYNHPVFIPIELRYEYSQSRHEQFDFLSGVSAEQRAETDLIRPEIFDALEARLERLSHVADHANIHFAHAATEVSREGRTINNWGVDEARESLKLLTETAELIGRWFLNSGVGNVLPTPQYDQFEHLDQPLIVPETFSILRQQWDMFSEEVANWPYIEDSDL